LKSSLPEETWYLARRKKRFAATQDNPLTAPPVAENEPVLWIAPGQALFGFTRHSLGAKQAFFLMQSLTALSD
jgi:hypothetical protein